VLGLLRANRNTSDAYTQAEHNQETVYVRAALAKKTHPARFYARNLWLFSQNRHLTPIWKDLISRFFTYRKPISTIKTHEPTKGYR